MQAIQSNFTIDFDRLRRDRLKKLQSEMAIRQIGALLITNPVNIRYATDVAVMPIWTALNLARYAVVPVQGDPVIFEYGKALHQAQALWPKSRPAKYWQFRFSQHTAVESSIKWASEIAELMQSWGLKGAKLGIDIMDCYGFEALKHTGLNVVDADEILEAAHLIKTPDELALIKQSCEVGERAMRAFENAIKPGVTEYELMSVFWASMLAEGGEYCSCRLISSGDRINPWFNEASGRKVQVGDLVGIDTDMAGPRGYLCDISRTFLCGDRANDDQREAYRVAYDFIQESIDLIRPGMDYREYMEKAPKYPTEYQELGYSCMIHGDGMDDEPPFFPFPHDYAKGALLPHGKFEPGMVLSVEFYAGKKGKRDGVKLEEQIVVTDSGTQLLAKYEFDERLLK
jgi:Xaa-Pro aminopeptidase